MEKRYEIDHTIRGDFYRIYLIKEYSNMPGFAPEKYDKKIGQVVVKFRDEEPYFQGSDNTYCVLEKEDIEEILDLLNRGFVKEDFN